MEDQKVMKLERFESGVAECLRHCGGHSILALNGCEVFCPQFLEVGMSYLVGVKRITDPSGGLLPMVVLESSGDFAA